VAQADLQVVRVEVRVPRAHGLVVVVEHAHEIDGQVADVAHAGVDVGASHGTGRRRLQIAEIGLIAGSRMGSRGVQT